MLERGVQRGTPMSVGMFVCPRVVNPSAGKGSPEGDANVRGYVCLFVCLLVPGHY